MKRNAFMCRVLSVAALALGATPGYAEAPRPDDVLKGLVRGKRACEAAGGSWYDSARLKGCHRRGAQTGVWELYDEENDGVLTALLAKDGERMEGPAIQFFPTGEVMAVMTHKADKVAGERRSFWRNGNPRESMVYRDDGSGRREGPWRQFAPHGGPMIEGAYVDDALDGPFVEWSHACVKRREGRYIKGQEEGTWYEWSDRGLLVSVGDYKAGKRVGVWRFHDAESGSLLEEGPYVEGLRDGLWTEHFANGFRFREVLWRADRRQSPDGVAACEAGRGTWAVDLVRREEGCLVGEPPDTKRLGVWTSWYDTGEKRRAETWEGGVLDGPVTEFHKDGKVLVEGRMRSGVPDGDWMWRDATGKIFGTATITAGTGAWVAYWPNGKLRESGAWRGGARHGVWTLNFENGNLELRETWDGGVRDGPMTAGYNTGEVKVEGAFKRDNRFGMWTAYYLTQRPAWRGTYSESGERTGAWENFHWEGSLRSAGAHVADAEEGPWRFWHETGELASEGPMRAGKRHGTWRFYWKNGELWREVAFVEGAEVGTGQDACEGAGGKWHVLADERAAGCEACRWAPAGTADAMRAEADGEGGGSPRVEATVEAGEIPVEAAPVVEETPEAAAGEAVTPAPKSGEAAARGEVLRSQEQQWIFWFPNGKREKEGRFEEGKPSGPWTFWYESGQTMLKGTFQAGVEDGAWEGFHPNGAARFRGTFAAGVEQGDWQVFHATGKPAISGRYEAGKKQGPWAWFDAEGRRQQEGTFVDDEETGAWKTFWPDGKVASEGTYDKGRRAGVWTWYRANGSVWRSASYVDGREAKARPPAP